MLSMRGLRAKLLIQCALLSLILLFVADAVRHIRAQDPDAAPANAQPANARPANARPADAQPIASEDATMLRTLGEEIFQVPNTFKKAINLSFYVALLILSIIAFTAALERLFHLKRFKLVPPQFVASLEDLIRGGRDSQHNLQTLANSSDSPIAKVLQSALLRAGRPLAEVEKGMEDAMGREMGAIKGKHRVLAVMGNVAPLVGLFGTVVGMIFAFESITRVTENKGTALAEGIYLALLTTAIGLLIAIPSILLVAFFNSKLERYMRDMDETLLQVLPSFTRMERSHAMPVASASVVGESPQSGTAQAVPR